MLEAICNDTSPQKKKQLNYKLKLGPRKFGLGLIKSNDPLRHISAGRPCRVDSDAAKRLVRHHARGSAPLEVDARPPNKGDDKWKGRR